jgi:hypothetical protein
MAPINFLFLNSDEEIKANRGLAAKMPQRLTPHLPLYGFRCSSKSQSEWFSSAWWIGETPFRTIQQYASANNVMLSYAARPSSSRIDKGGCQWQIQQHSRCHSVLKV